jgi:opacity protein-like surface antigen
MSSKQHTREEHVMKKLAIIGMVFAGLMLSSASAWATPTGTTKAEYRALMLRSEGLNQKYGLGQYSQQAIVASKLGEIGAWAVPSPQQTDTTPLVSEKLAGLDVGTPTTTATSGEGFDWNDAGIGAALALGFVVLGVGSLLTVRQQHKPIPH